MNEREQGGLRDAGLLPGAVDQAILEAMYRALKKAVAGFGELPKASRTYLECVDAVETAEAAGVAANGMEGPSCILVALSVGEYRWLADLAGAEDRAEEDSKLLCADTPAGLVEKLDGYRDAADGIAESEDAEDEEDSAYISEKVGLSPRSRLTLELQAYCTAHGLEQRCAHELVGLEGVPEDCKEWLRDFVRRWDALDGDYTEHRLRMMEAGL